MTVLETRSHQFSAAVTTDLKIMRNKGGLAPRPHGWGLAMCSPSWHAPQVPNFGGPLGLSCFCPAPICQQEDLALIKTEETNKKKKIMRTIVEPLRLGHGLMDGPTVLAPFASSMWHWEVR